MNQPPTQRGIRAIQLKVAFGAIIALSAIACGERITAPESLPANARFEGLLGGTPFVAIATAQMRPTTGAPDTLYLWASRATPSGPTTEYLTIRVPFAGTGEYVLGEDQVILWELIGGDGIVGEWTGSAPNPGQLVITEFGGTGRIMRGTVRFWLTSPRTNPDEGPLEFTEGVFTVRLGAPLATQ